MKSVSTIVSVELTFLMKLSLLYAACGRVEAPTPLMRFVVPVVVEIMVLCAADVADADTILMLSLNWG